MLNVHFKSTSVYDSTLELRALSREIRFSQSSIVQR